MPVSTRSATGTLVVLKAVFVRAVGRVADLRVSPIAPWVRGDLAGASRNQPAGTCRQRGLPFDDPRFVDGLGDESLPARKFCSTCRKYAAAYERWSVGIGEQRAPF